MYLRQFADLKARLLSEQKVTPEDTPEYQTIAEQLGILRRVMKHLSEGDWTTAKARERVMHTLKYGYAESAEKYDTTVSSVKSGLSQAGDKVRALFFGVDILSLITDGRVDEAECLFELATNQHTTTQLFPAEVWNVLPEAALAQVSHEDFVQCAQMLRSVGTWSLIGRLDILSKSVLGVARYFLLSNRPEDIQTRMVLYRYINCDIDTDAMVEYFRANGIIS